MNNIKELIEYGLDRIDEDKKICIKTKDLMYIYKSIEELRRFFHNTNHYVTLDDVNEYIGNKDEGMYAILTNIYINIFDEVFDKEISEKIDNDVFHSKEKPYYYNRK